MEVYSRGARYSEYVEPDQREQKPSIGRRGSYAKGVARRNEILDRAIEVFRERGADGTSLRSIAAAIGVSHAALLHYFDSREQLLIAVYAHQGTGSSEGVEADVRRTAVDLMVHAASENVRVPGLVKLYSTLVAASLENSSELGTEYFTERFERLRLDLAERLRAEQQQGTVRRDVDPMQVAALIIAASDGLQIQWLLEPSIELENTLRVLATLLEP